MLMTDQLTEQAAALLAAIRRAGDWCTRGEILEHLNADSDRPKTRLNKWDTKLLGDLTDAGLIEARKVAVHSPKGYEWQYRAKS